MDFANLKNFMDDMAREHTPGNAAEVYKDGKLVFRYASGYSDLEENIPMHGDETLYIFSCSKVVTAVAGMQMLEKGKILLSDPLYDYIPEFREMYVRNPDGTLVKAQKPITVGNLFTMTAGFTYDLNAPGFQRARQETKGAMDTVETIRCVASDPLVFEPGSRWQYSICHDVLAALISVVSGKKFRDYVRDFIFQPLNMAESGYHQTERTRENMAALYRFMPYGGPEQDLVEAQKSGNARRGFFKRMENTNEFILGEEYDSGGAGIITTVSDYAKLTAALANGGLGLTGERILSRHAVELMRTDQLTEEQKKGYNWAHLAGCGYGLGVRTHTDPARSGVMSSVGEFGWGGAAGATVIVDPSVKLGVFYAQHTLNPREAYYQPRLRNVVYSCL